MPELTVLRTLALIFTSALLAGLAARWLRQSAILGYLATGIIIGPFAFNLIPDTKFLQEYANIGVALLMFAIGLEFSFRELIPVRKIAIFGTHIQVGLTVLLGIAVGRALHWSWQSSLVLGCTMAISSSMVVLNTLNERGELSTQAGRVMIGMLIVQDMAVVVMTTLFPLLTTGDILSLSAPLFILLIKATLTLFACVALGKWVIPFILHEVTRFHSKQLVILSAVAMALGTAYVTHKIGLTLSLGAFLAGLMIGNSKYSHAILAEVSPLKDAFSILFFVSIGTLLSPSILSQHIVHLSILMFALIAGKFIINSITTLFFNYTGKISVCVGMGLIPIGEFSFVLAQVALDLHIISINLYTLILAIAIFSTALTPLFFKLSPVIYEKLNRLKFLPRITYLSSKRFDHIPEEEKENHVILCGYGRVGRYIGRALHNFKQETVVIDPYPFRVEEAHSDGLYSLYGDPSKGALLKKAGLKKASLLVISLPDIINVKLVILEARRLRNDIPIVVRFRDALDLEDMSDVPKLFPVLAEFEGALRMVRQSLLLCNFEPRGYLSRLAKEVYQEEQYLDSTLD